MDIRSRKASFVKSLELEEDQKRAVELAIDCIIENEASKEDLPIVFTSIFSDLLSPVLDAVKTFLESLYPHCEKDLFSPRQLTIWSSSLGILRTSQAILL